MQDWKVGRRQGACTGCEASFGDGERFFSTISVEEDAVVRHDLCAACWRARGSAAEPAAQDSVEAPGEPSRAGRDLVFWRARHHEHADRRLRLDVQALETLFFGLEGRADRELRELRYLLCLLLMRKRRLKTVRIERHSEAREGEAGECFVVRRPRRQEELVVHVFDFTAERMDELRHKLVRLFDGADPDEALAAEPVGVEDVEGASREDAVLEGDEEAIRPASAPG